MILKRIHVFNFLVIFALVCAFALLTFSGCATSTNWVRNTIKKNYYRFDGDYSSLSNLKGLSVNEMMEKLDRYSAYYTRDEFAAVSADNAGSKSGIGISYSFSQGAGVVIHSVVGNSPAKKAGLKAGDVVTSATVGGENVQFSESSDFSSFVTARDTGENFTLYLAGGSAVTLAKAEYTASYASMYTNDTVYEIEYDSNGGRVVKGKNGIAELPEGTAYMYLSQFYGGAAEEVAALISVFNQCECTSLILDLRNNGGGYVELMSQIGGRFTSSVVDGNAVSIKAIYKDGREEVEYCYNYSQNVVPAGTNVYVMANHNTASASEALIGVLVSYNILKYENIFLSEYEGYAAKSYGKGIMQRTFENYLTGEALKLTVAGIYWANGITIHDVGLTASKASNDPVAPDNCSVAPASDDIVNIGYDDELAYVIKKIISDTQL